MRNFWTAPLTSSRSRRMRAPTVTLVVADATAPVGVAQPDRDAPAAAGDVAQPEPVRAVGADRRVDAAVPGIVSGCRPRAQRGRRTAHQAFRRTSKLAPSGTSAPSAGLVIVMAGPGGSGGAGSGGPPGSATVKRRSSSWTRPGTPRTAPGTPASRPKNTTTRRSSSHARRSKTCRVSGEEKEPGSAAYGRGPEARLSATIAPDASKPTIRTSVQNSKQPRLVVTDADRDGAGRLGQPEREPPGVRAVVVGAGLAVADAVARRERRRPGPEHLGDFGEPDAGDLAGEPRAGGRSSKPATTSRASASAAPAADIAAAHASAAAARLMVRCLVMRRMSSRTRARRSAPGDEPRYPSAKQRSPDLDVAEPGLEHDRAAYERA